MINKADLNSLYQYAMALGVSQADAADLVQETVEKTLLHFNGTEEVKPKWMRKTLRNRHIDVLRRLQRFHHQPFDTVEEQDIYALDTERLEDLIISEGEFEFYWGLLKQNEKELVYLWAIEGYTAAEIGEQMDCSRNTILSRIHRIKGRLKQAYEQSNVTNKDSGSLSL